MKKILFLEIILMSFSITGCTDEVNGTLDQYNYVYPDSKDVIVTLEKYNQLKSGMTEQEVWNIIGGHCTNTGTTDIGAGDEFVTISYGCNGNGIAGSNVILMFQSGKLVTMSQTGLK